MSRGLPGRDRRTTRHVRIAPPTDADPHGNRAQRRAWAKSNPTAPKSNETAREVPEGPRAAYPDGDTRTGRTAAHGAAGHRRDATPHDSGGEFPCHVCRMAGPVHDPGCLTRFPDTLDTTEEIETP